MAHNQAAQNQAVVWIEPHEAQVFSFHADKVERKTVAKAEVEEQPAARDQATHPADTCVTIGASSKPCLQVSRPSWPTQVAG